MSQILVAFIVFKVVKFLVERSLSQRNRQYYLDTQRQEEAKKTLGISDPDFAKILAYTENKYSYGQISGWLNLAVMLNFVACGGFRLVEQTAISLTNGQAS